MDTLAEALLAARKIINIVTNHRKPINHKYQVFNSPQNSCLLPKYFVLTFRSSANTSNGITDRIVAYNNINFTDILSFKTFNFFKTSP